MANPFDTKKSSGSTATATKPKGGLAAAGGDEDSEPKTVRRGDPFAMPSGGGGDYKFSEFLGELLLVRPTEEGTMDTEVANDSEYVRADVVRLDNENEQVEDLLVFQVALIRTLKKVMRGPNEWVLGRLARGEAKKGKSAPYILSKPTDEEIAQAEEVMEQLGLL